MGVSGISAGMIFPLAQRAAGRRTGAPANGPAGAEGDAAQTSEAQSPQNQTPETQQQVSELRQADSSVRQHEAAHQSAGGAYAGGASFQTVQGPDGRSYAVGGEVPIDISPERDPTATIRKMETVKRAALAPSDPSPQDMRVAAQADAQKAQAQQELRREQEQGGEGGGPEGAAANPALAARGAAAYGAASSIGANRSTGVGLVL
ncbi:putative metalloprotease CJM1_0395 family protein [Azospirillum sp.]|uniref:putative metalloprotease CJM1_0395 family protein n=1 Tax=Azospirillum sp. TaxID=34012 RepID=UPI002D669E60|nr:putative metalloprotease CJM1_0395 family protein [Azospirillum sp.]HYD68341.1 putative metalloprotease CJM1_0395 family protein [Azospirillum sp.]